MNDKIINNLFQFWKHIGGLNNTLKETESYSATLMDHSDWPNRIFDLKTDKEGIDKIIKLSQDEKLPPFITLAKPNDLRNHPSVEFRFSQRNMALDLKHSIQAPDIHPNIKRVKNQKEAVDFAQTASTSFGYRVDSNVVFKLAQESPSIRLFIYQENKVCLGCGIIYFDVYDYAGLHMIGTIPKARGKGIGKSMTEQLLIEARKNKAKTCVLHASSMGEVLYKKLGFMPWGQIESYEICTKGSVQC